MKENAETARAPRLHVEHIAVGVLALALVGYTLGAFEPVRGCLRAAAWPRELIALHVVADGLVFIAYIWIPTVLILIWLRLKARPEARLLYLFGAFIVLCGWTHLDSIVTTWFPAYWYAGGIKLATGGVSIATAIVLTKLAPQLVGLGSMAADLQAARDEADALRQKETARADRAEGDVHALQKAETDLKEALAREAALRRQAQESAASAEDARLRAESAISERQAAMRAVKDLSTPVLPLTDQVILTPLIGAVDSLRAAQWMDVTLEAVGAYQASIVIVDLSGVPVVDTQVASAVLKTVQAVGLLGGKCIITGIRPSVAQTMVDLGIDMSGVRTESTLKAGLAGALGK